MPEPDETLDAPVYEPPKRSKRTLAKVTWAILALTIPIVLLVAINAGILHTRGPHPGMVTRHLVRDMVMACDSYRMIYGTWPWPEPATVTPATEIHGKEVCTLLRRGGPGHEDLLREAIWDLKHPAFCASFMRDGALLDEWGREIMFRVDRRSSRR